MKKKIHSEIIKWLKKVTRFITVDVAFKIWNFIIRYFSSISLMWSLWFLIVVLINLDDLKTIYNLDGISRSQWTITYYTMLIWTILASINALRFFMFEYKAKQYKKRLSKEWYRNFIDYEYKKNDISTLSILAYLLIVWASLLSIYISVTSMQLSIDIAQYKWEWDINISGTKEMFTLLSGWLAISMIMIPFLLFIYKFHQLSKQAFLEEIFYDEYKKTKKH